MSNTTFLDNKGVRVKVGSFIWKFMPKKTGAFAFYNTIHVRSPIKPRLSPGTRDAFAKLLAHEYGHVLQYRTFPVSFLLQYYLGILFGALQSMWNTAKVLSFRWYDPPFRFLDQWAKPQKHFRSGYWNHPFEVEARAFEQKHFAEWIMALEEVP